MATTIELRTVLGVMGLHDSDIDDSDERDAIIEAVEKGHVHRESRVDNELPADFVRVVEYDVPGTDLTRYAIHREQGDGLSYIHDHTDRAPVDAAYEHAVRELAEDCGYEFAETDVDGLPPHQPHESDYDLDDEDEEDDEG